MSTGVNNVIRQARYRVVTFASTRPALYYGIRKIAGKMDHLCIEPDTELVIEGYPRSANSTTVSGFQARQPRKIRVAHHKHHAAQLLVAAQRGIPAVMLIRQPEDAILSNLALVREAKKRSGNSKRGELTFHDVLLSWIAFYRVLEDQADNFVIAPFQEVIHDISGMIRDLNKKFGTDFQDALPVATVAKPLGWHAMPNDLCSSIKRDLSEEFAQSLLDSAGLREMLNDANTRYQRFMEIYERHR